MALFSQTSRNANASPQDRTKREHIASIRRVVWTNGDVSNPFSIFETAGGHKLKGPALETEFEGGQLYRFYGVWTDSNYGPSFAFQAFVRDTPVGRAGTIKYLCDVCAGTGVGQKTFEKIWNEYEGKTIDFLRDGSPCSDIIDDQQAEKIANILNADAAMVNTKVDLINLFLGRGFGNRAVQASIAAWGIHAPAKIKRNPFVLLVNKIPGAGFKRCDKLHTELGLSPRSLKRQMFFLWDQLRLADGHTWIPIEDADHKLSEAIAAADTVKAVKFGRRSGWISTRRDSENRLWISSTQRAVNEESIRTNLMRLAAADAAKGSLWGDDLPVSVEEGDRLPSEHQRTQGLAATRLPVGVLTGGPGTGKTHTLGFILRGMRERVGENEIVVVAPTGKAAVRASQALASQGVAIRARTIHSLLLTPMDGNKKPNFNPPDDFHYSRRWPLPVKVVIVDESSMIDTDLMAALLAACQDGTHVLFIGDIAQLPPVGHGSPLRDMIESGVIPVGELTEVRRNAGAIVHGCRDIKAGRGFDTQTAYNPETGANLLHYETDGERGTIEVVERILENASRFDPVWGTQIIVARNDRGDLSRVALNKKLHKQLNPDGIAITGNPFKVGDKVICLKNGKFKVVEFVTFRGKPGGETNADNYHAGVFTDENEIDHTEVRVANGEIGRVIAIAAKSMVVRIGEFDCPVLVPIGRIREEIEEVKKGEDDSRGEGCDFVHAYACTCHKMQGSESPLAIIVGDPQGGMVCDRSWLYTAVSRASKLCVLVGPRRVFDAMVRRVKLEKRKTFLKELLIEAKQAKETKEQEAKQGAITNG
jgi:exodeoxyribonuclease V alpha subunit